MVERNNRQKKRVLNCRSFFGVAELASIQLSHSVAFRKQREISEISDLGVLAWLRRAELEGLNVEVDKFNKGKLKGLIPRFREMTMEQPDVFYPDMQRLCAECGVALLLVPYLPKTYICGATIWRNDKAILALSIMGKRADGFWFTFFHELVHLINHSGKEFHVSYNRESEEDEADLEASNYLISEQQYKDFIESYDYGVKANIVEYSEKIGIAPFILLGRLQHDKLIDYHCYRDLIASFEIKENNAVSWR